MRRRLTGSPPVVQTFPLAEAARAHAAMESRHTVGKAVLVPDAG
ncbi:zinc-binding dehydrogenase [Saccharothrix deserti]|nr:zinc-binding dehydrogenase [Saccharothrix deserti]